MSDFYRSRFYIHLKKRRRKNKMKVLGDFSNIFKRYDLDLEVTGEARTVSECAMMQEIAQFVIDGYNERILPAVKKALESKSPLDIINDALFAGMNEVIRLWDEGVYFLPQVILSSDAMIVGIAECEAKMGKVMGRKSTVVTNKAEGDIHYIRKVFVHDLLGTTGFNVVNLGADVPVEKVVSACKDQRPFMVTGIALTTIP